MFIGSDNKSKCSQFRCLTAQTGFILLPVVLTITMIAAIAFLLNREGAMAINDLGGEMQSSQASLAAKAGMNHMLWQATNANCIGYTNLSATAFGANSYSATISPTSNSPVSITATGTDAGGATYTISRDRVTMYQPYKTVTLQLGTDPGKDASIYNNQPTINFGGGDNSVVKSWFIIWFYKNQLLQFDLPSSIPTNAHIVSAQLQLYQKSNLSDGDVSVYRVTQSWVEGTKNGSGTADGATWTKYDGTNAWTTVGGDYDTTVISTSTVTSSSDIIVSFEIGSLVQDWLNGKYVNNGLLLKAEGMVSPTFASKEDATISNRPKLIVTYTCECGQPCSSCAPADFRDNFTTIAYSGNNGSQNWTNSWQESGETDGPTTGKLSVISATQCASGNCIKLRKDTTALMSLTREVNLSTAKSATLSFNYRRTIVSGSAGGTISLEISKDGGATFSNLKTYPLNVTDSASTSESIDISPYMAVNTRVRFKIDAGSSYQTNMHIDDVVITASCSAPPLVATLNPVADTDIAENNTSTNYGTSTTVWVGKDSNGKQYKGLMKFDVSTIPANATIISAKLRLNLATAVGSSSFDIGLYKIKNTWSETTATWSNFSSGGNYYSTQLAVATVATGTTGFKEWTVPTGLINEWIDGIPGPNYGLALVDETSSNRIYLQFSSRENSTVANRPQLVINYTLP